jgi:hypothetical protein
MRTVTIGGDAFFDTNKATFRKEAQPELEKSRARVRNVSSVEAVQITGYTDNTGAADYNQKLSEARAADGEGLPGEERHRPLEDHHPRQGGERPGRRQRHEGRPRQEPALGDHGQGRRWKASSRTTACSPRRDVLRPSPVRLRHCDG